MLSPSKKFNKIQLPVSQLLYTQAKEVGGERGEGRRYPGFQVTGKIKMGAKIKSQKKKSLALQTKPKKIPAMPNFQAIKVYSQNFLCMLAVS